MAALVWLLWALLLASALAFVALFGTDLPYWDDWNMIPAVVGRQPISLGWLWALHNEHRIPLPKLLYLGLAWAAGGDLRAGMIFNVLVLGAASALLLAAVRRARGRTVLADA